MKKYTRTKVSKPTSVVWATFLKARSKLIKRMLQEGKSYQLIADVLSIDASYVRRVDNIQQGLTANGQRIR